MNIFRTPTLQKIFQKIIMIQRQVYYTMTCVMCFCMCIETSERPCELIHPVQLYNYATKVDQFRLFYQVP